jgi:hypothetical protein
MTVATRLGDPTLRKAFSSDCCIMYPIQPAVAATSTPSGNGGAS